MRGRMVGVSRMAKATAKAAKGESKAGTAGQPEAFHGMPPLKIEILPIESVKPNPNNPRVVRDRKFEALVRSIREFPEMLSVRPIVVNEEMIVLGGNQRLRACQAAEMKQVPVGIARGWTKEQQEEFIVKDNNDVGEWDWIKLAEQFGKDRVEKWGVDFPVVSELSAQDMDKFFKDNPKDAGAESESKHSITLHFTEADFARVKEALGKIAGTPEMAVWRLLKLDDQAT